MTTLGCTGMLRRVAVRRVTGELDDAFSLDAAQREQARASLNLLVDEVPGLILPELSELIAELDETLDLGATEERLLSLERGWERLIDRVAGRVIGELAQLLATLSDAQIDHGAAYAREKLAEARQEQRGPAAERLEERGEKFVEAVESWSGPLSVRQAQALRAHMALQPDESAAKFRADDRRLDMIERALHAHPGAPALRAVLFSLWQGRDDLSPDGPSTIERRARGRETLLFVDAMMTSAQRAHARAHLADEYARARRLLGGG